MKGPFNRFYYRTAAALFLGILASALLLVSIAWLMVGRPMVQYSTANFARQIQNAANTYARLDEAGRSRFRQRLLDDIDVTLEPAASTSLTGERPRLPYFVNLEKALSRLAGEPVPVVRQGDLYVFDFPGPPPLRFYFSRDRTGAEPVLALSAMAILGVLFSLITALLIANFMARPIESIAHRTDTQYKGGLLTPLPEEGPREIREIVRNFNLITSQNKELLNKSTIMLAGISHDLRAPITRARMALELARASMDESLAERIERALMQMETLIAQYLDFTDGSIKEGASPLKISVLLKEITQTYRHAKITLDVADDVVYLPSRAFIRCAQNLVDNAVKHGIGAPVHVTFRKSASSWILEIADHGLGIPDSELEKVFQPFLRLDGARTQLGSGLGLSIVQEICRAQGWFVTLASRPGGGLIARIAMPVAAQS